MNTRLLGVAVAACFVSSPGGVAAEDAAVVETRALSPRLAHAIVDAALQDCVARGYKVSAAVVDRHGNLSAFLRDPLAGPHTIEVARKKAYTSATTQRATAVLAARSDLRFAPGMLLIVGGLPIAFNGHFYGGVAVSGATPEVDEQCARAGIDTAAETMEFVE